MVTTRSLALLYVKIFLLRYNERTSKSYSAIHLERVVHEFIFILILIIILFLFSGGFSPIFNGIPWQPTDMKRVKRMLEMAKLKPDETLYDLGCGDGRILIYAAQNYRAKAVGIEINPWLFALSWVRVFSGFTSPG